MVNILNTIADVISSIIGFVVNIITSLVSLIQMLPNLISFTFSAIGYLPAIVAPYCYVTITLSVLFLILGRSGK